MQGGQPRVCFAIWCGIFWGSFGVAGSFSQHGCSFGKWFCRRRGSRRVEFEVEVR